MKRRRYLKNYYRWGVLRILCLCVGLSLLCSVLAYLRVASSLDYALEDRLYQKADTPSDQIVVVGITAEDMERFAAWQWDRNTLAQAIRQINSDSQNRPAAIGIDMLLSAEMNVEGDVALAEACREAGNVVTASYALYDTQEFSKSADRIKGTMTAESVLRPYDQLADATVQGHTNVICDRDGVARRHLWRVKDAESGELSSMAEQLYRLYCEYHGTSEQFVPPLSGEFWYVEYTAKPGAYFTYSLSDICDGNFDASELAGRIVLIGAYLPETVSYITSIDKTHQMYSVEYQANVLNAMLNGSDMRGISDLAQVLVLFAITILVSFLLLRSPVISGLYTYAGAVVIDIVVAFILKGCGYMIHPLWTPLQMTSAMILSLSVNYIYAKEGQNELYDLCRRYIDPGILNELLKIDTASGVSGNAGKHADIAVLFVDIRSFTSLTERIAPEGVVDILNRYLAMTSACVQQNDGIVDKFVGDSTMAMWGGVRACEDAVWKACKAGMDMVAQMEELSSKVEQEYGCKLAYGVGIHYGEAIIGNIGSERRMDYTAIGDVVNTAARIESIAPAGKVYVSARVREMLGDRVAAGKPVGSILLKGKQEPIELYEIKELYVAVHSFQNFFPEEVAPSSSTQPETSGKKNDDISPYAALNAKLGRSLNSLR